MLPTPEPREDPDPDYRPLLDTRPFFIETISDDKARSIKLYQSKAEALEAAGLAE